MKLLKPDIHNLPAYLSALHRGWLPDNVRPEAAQEQIASIAKDAETFVANLDDPTAKACRITLPDGSKVPRLPSFRRWIWDDEFCGHIGLRWKPGTEALPPTCSGHIGYTIVPWRRGEGLATAALVAFLPEARAVGLKYVEITTNSDNRASARVIEKAGGTLVKTYVGDQSLGARETLLFKIPLAA
ncbi:GNAT family N-acetyltransferase [Phaeobacter sp. J2-8]|uniref:GNAT family N-acetyltransferase n=1 Tax=Phaeobacter sp. J2-8 TaxID=2931394 RepID=UPI001FD23638|nr:GNAT family N-acetyltransferase [Phaeobacter sp. J2-8]MCJ7872154.1 GNAT family N-acetyltransferase [Phaeobacter sp. J2-8]